MPLRDEVTPRFPDALVFALSADPPVRIESAEVRYRVASLTCGAPTSTGVAEVTQGERMGARWEWDLRRSGGLPIGATLVYHWRIAGEGRVFETVERTLVHEDPRFDWHEIAGEHTTLRWYTEDEAFARGRPGGGRRGDRAADRDDGSSAEPSRRGPDIRGCGNAPGGAGLPRRVGWRRRLPAALAGCHRDEPRQRRLGEARHRARDDPRRDRRGRLRLRAGHPDVAGRRARHVQRGPPRGGFPAGARRGRGRGTGSFASTASPGGSPAALRARRSPTRRAGASPTISSRPTAPSA